MKRDKVTVLTTCYSIPVQSLTCCHFATSSSKFACTANSSLDCARHQHGPSGLRWSCGRSISVRVDFQE